MKKSDLRSGDIVETRSGNRYIVLLNARGYMKKDILCNLNDGCYCVLDSFNEDLTNLQTKEADIMKVCADDYTGDNLRAFRITKENWFYTEKWTWIRREEKKKMTVAQICKELGYDVEIIKED